MKKLLLIVALTMLFVGVSSAQQMVFLDHYSKNDLTAADSADFQHSYVFPVPEGVRTDSLQLFVYTTSVLGDVDIDITTHGGIGDPSTATNDTTDYYCRCHVIFIFCKNIFLSY